LMSGNAESKSPAATLTESQQRDLMREIARQREQLTQTNSRAREAR